MPLPSKSWEVVKSKGDSWVQASTPAQSPITTPPHCFSSSQTRITQDSWFQTVRVLPPRVSMWPKNAAPQGVLAPSRSKSHQAPGILAQGFSPAREPQCLAPVLPSRLLQQKQRGWASRRSLPLPVQPPRHACDYSGQAAFTRSEGSHPHKGALCLWAPGPAAGASGTAPPQGRESDPPVPRPAPPTLTLHREAIPTPGFKARARLGLPQPAPSEAGSTRTRGAQTTPRKLALSARCALNASCSQEGLSTPYPSSPPAPSPGLETPAPRLTHL